MNRVHPFGTEARRHALAMACLLRARWTALVALVLGAFVLQAGLNAGIMRLWENAPALFGGGASWGIMSLLGVLQFLLRPEILLIVVLLALIARHPMVRAPRTDLRLAPVQPADLVAGIWLAVFLPALGVALLGTAYGMVRHGMWPGGSYSFLVDWSTERNWKPLGASTPGLHLPRWMVDIPLMVLTRAMLVAGVACVVMRQFLLRGVGTVGVVAAVGFSILFALGLGLVAAPLLWIENRFLEPGPQRPDSVALVRGTIGLLLQAGFTLLACRLALRGLPARLVEHEP